MNQQEKMKLAKDATLERLKEVFADFEQVGEYSFASLEEVEGEEWWTVVSIQAKKNYDVDGAIADYEFTKAEKEKKKKKENRSEKPTK